jgi:hypothetical protein
MKDKDTIQYYDELLTAYGALRSFITSKNLTGKYYTNNGEFIYRTDSVIYAINNSKEGYYICIYNTSKK